MNLRQNALAIAGLFLITGCQAGGMLPGSSPSEATKQDSAVSTSGSKTDSGDASGVAGSGLGGIAGGANGVPEPMRYDGSGSAGSSSSSAAATPAHVDPFSAQVDPSSIFCPPNAPDDTNCPPPHTLMMYHGNTADDPRLTPVEASQFVRVIEVPPDVASNMGLTSGDDFLQKVRLGTISEADAKAVTYRDVAVSVAPDGTFAVPSLKPGMNIVLATPTQTTATSQSFQSSSEILSTIANTARLSTIHSSLSGVIKADPSLLMRVRER